MHEPAGAPHVESLRARLGHAFSPRRIVRQLVRPPPGRLGPLDGLRALSLLWVVVFHAGWYLALHLPVESYSELVFSPWMLPAWRGDFGVDVFFVLSGHLIAGMLIDEHARSGRIRVALFAVRRLARLWPALGVAVLLDVAFIEVRPAEVWANLLYVSNFVPIFDAAMGWTWSLSIEEQFYLVCPWLVLALGQAPQRWRALATLLCAATLVAIGAWIVTASDFHALDTEIVINRELADWARGYDSLYAKPWMRAGPLLAGVASAYVYRLPRAMDALARSRRLATLGLALALVLALLCTHWPLAAGAPRALEVAYVAGHRTLFGIAVAYGLLLSLSRHPVGALLGRMLSSRLLYPFAQLAYCAYLVNPIATTLVDRLLAPAMPTPAAYLVLLPLDMLATFAAAALLHVFVEQPFMELRPRGANRAALTGAELSAQPEPVRGVAVRDE